MKSILFIPCVLPKAYDTYVYVMHICTDVAIIERGMNTEKLDFNNYHCSFKCLKFYELIECNTIHDLSILLLQPLLDA